MKRVKGLLWLVGSMVVVFALAYVIAWNGTSVSHSNWSGPVNECAYIGIQPGEGGGPELLSATGCGRIDEQGALHVDQSLLQRVYFKGTEPSCLLLPDRAFYIDKRGKAVETYLFDAGCDYYSEGLVRAPSVQGTRFIDDTLTEVIATPYQFAMPFHEGVAVVCDELHLRHDLYKGRQKLVGGRCGYIDKKGALIVPLHYPIDEIYGHRPKQGDTQSLR